MKKILIIILCLLFICSCGKIDEVKNDDNINIDTLMIDNDDIKEISVRNSYILMLDKNNDLYLYGNYTSNHVDVSKEPKKINSNVKYYKDEGRLSIIDNNDNAYYIGLDKEGDKTNNDFELLLTNVKKVSSNSFCFYVIDKDNDLRIKIPSKNKDAIKYCALPNDYKGDFSKEIKDVKDIYTSLTINGYVTNNNELYASFIDNPNFVNVLSNVNYVLNGYVLTNDNRLYNLRASVINREIEAIKVNENVSEVYINDFYKLNTGEFYYINTKLDQKDIKVPLYYKTNKFVYINTNDKIVLVIKEGNKELDIKIESMKEILDYLKE